jgi:hypothetical protein
MRKCILPTTLGWLALGSMVLLVVLRGDVGHLVRDAVLPSLEAGVLTFRLNWLRLRLKMLKLLLLRLRLRLGNHRLLAVGLLELLIVALLTRR